MKKIVFVALVLALLCPGLALAAAPEIDRAGNPIALPENPARILSLTPATTQVIESLGLKGSLVAVDTQTPLYVEDIQTLPQFDMMSPDCEAMAALTPDVVFVSSMSAISGSDPFKPLKDLGVCVVEIPSSESIQGVEEDVQFIADCLGKTAEGEAIVADMRADFEAVAAIGATVSEKKTVLFEISALPYIYSFGQGTFLDEMIALIGAQNVFADQQGWIPVTEESAVAANPDVILTSVNYIEDPVGEVLSRVGWENVKAVQDKAVYAIDNGASSLPNQYIVDALIEMAQAVYPELYQDLAA